MVALKLDADNKEFNMALEFVNSTDELLFLTGKAGTGKTTFLSHVKEQTDKNTIVLAPTGVAAINAGGNTINSFFQVPFSPFIPRDKRLRLHVPSSDPDKTSIFNTFKYRREKRAIIENLELLIIDEVSMVRCDTIDVIDRVLRAFRNNSAPFGGVQVLLIGDPYQLSPVVKDNDWEILRRDYETEFFFSSHALKNHLPNYIELQKIYRQKDMPFIQLLNKVRMNNVSNDDIEFLNSKYEPRFIPAKNDSFIILASNNAQVNNINARKLNDLNAPARTYQGELTGVFPKRKGRYVLPTSKSLDLKVGAQVMFLVNDTGRSKRYFNGKIVKIKALYEDEIEVITPEGSSIMVQPHTWRNVEYSWNAKKQKVEEKEKGTFTQFPIRLAWAITVHKSQGLTFEQVYADVANAFAPGQVYVALSRCRSMEGLKLKSRIPRNAIKTEAKVINFMDKCRTRIPYNMISNAVEVKGIAIEEIASDDSVSLTNLDLEKVITSSVDNEELERTKQMLRQMEEQVDSLRTQVKIEKKIYHKLSQLYDEVKIEKEKYRKENIHLLNISTVIKKQHIPVSGETLTMQRLKIADQEYKKRLEVITTNRDERERTLNENFKKRVLHIEEQYYNELQKVRLQLIHSREEITELWSENQELIHNTANGAKQNRPRLIRWLFSMFS